jgi:hypothetical protein
VEKKKELASWLEAPDPSRTHNNLLGQHHEGTGEWFFGTEKYHRWREGRSSILWIRGKRMSPSVSVLMLASDEYDSWEREKRDMVSIFAVV